MDRKENPKEWVDQCTSLKPQDANYKNSQKLVGEIGCKTQNEKLTECLSVHKKDWRFCKVLST